MDPLEKHNKEMLERKFSNHTCGLTKNQAQKIDEGLKDQYHCYGAIRGAMVLAQETINSQSCVQCQREKGEEI